MSRLRLAQLGFPIADAVAPSAELAGYGEVVLHRHHTRIRVALSQQVDDEGDVRSPPGRILAVASAVPRESRNFPVW